MVSDSDGIHPGESNEVKMIVVEIASASSLALASLVGEGGQAPAAASVPARDDQIVLDNREAADAPHFSAAAHEKVQRSANCL
eukprot:SAG31_NODE_26898_length_434_cov_1.229851_1_plen_83_part_00